MSNQDTMEHTMQEVAQMFGWSHDEREGTIITTDGEPIEYFISREQPGRIVIKGHITHEQYQTKPLSVEIPRITVDVNKSAGRICDDIKRRLLPVWQEAYAKIVGAENSHNQYVQTVMVNKAILVNAGAGKVSASTHTERLHLSINPNGNRYLYGDIDVYGDSVNLDLHNLPVETAAYIIKMLAQYKG